MEVLGVLIRATIDNTNKIDNLNNELKRCNKTIALYALLTISSLYFMNKKIKDLEKDKKLKRLSRTLKL